MVGVTRYTEYEIISDFIVFQVCNLPGIHMYNDFYSFKVISSI